MRNHCHSTLKHWRTFEYTANLRRMSRTSMPPIIASYVSIVSLIPSLHTHTFNIFRFDHAFMCRIPDLLWSVPHTTIVETLCYAKRHCSRPTYAPTFKDCLHSGPVLPTKPCHTTLKPNAQNLQNLAINVCFTQIYAISHIIFSVVFLVQNILSRQ